MARLDQVIYNAIVHFVIKSVPATRVEWDAERKKPAEVPTPFVPSREDLLQHSYSRITPEVYKTLVRIWNDTDPVRGGVRGVSKYCAYIVQSARLNFLRDEFQRKDEINNGRSLSSPVFDSEESLQFEDAITDPDPTQLHGVQEVLQEELAEKDFDVLRRCVVDGMSVRAYAERSGESKSVVGRRLQQAKEVAKQFVPQLRPDRKSLRTSIALTISSSLRPDSISPENIAGFAETLKDQVCAFHDPELEWRERHYASLRVPREKAA